jgi:hypothetical protein
LVAVRGDAEDHRPFTRSEVLPVVAEAREEHRDQCRHESLAGTSAGGDVGRLPIFTTLGSWERWLVFLKALFAVEMTADELAIYEHHTGRRTPPSTSPSEVYDCAVSRDAHGHSRQERPIIVAMTSQQVLQIGALYQFYL